MNIEELRNYCLSKPGVTEGFPFDETTLVFKVLGKMFALTNTDGEFSMNLKCDPQKAIELREHYPAVKPGYHMNKKHWNTIWPDDSIDDFLIYKWIDDSYDLVVSKLTKVQKEMLKKDLRQAQSPE
ncbi:MAG: MmcQ/YjbR family DNA-binding protein [Bacteroidetes bacterium]|nr:MAG: MmcQ/YjbR family DNA-binding protein [Bacteroidota bacterium]